MEIKGDEFLKKVQKRQEQEELEQKLNDINQNQTPVLDNNGYDEITNKPPVQTNIPPKVENSISDYQDEESELRDIRLENSITSSNEENKKKYLILGLVLIVLFLSTILIIKLLNDDSDKSDTSSFEKTNTEKSSLDDSNIEENYKKILDNRLNREVEQNEVSNEEPLKIVEKDANDLNIKEDKIKDEDLENIISKIKEQEVKKTEKKEEPVIVEKKPIYKPVKKNEIVQEEKPKKTVKDIINSSTPSGYFVQVGAFSKTPSQAYINNIRRVNLKYKIYKTEVKGKTFNKVLIGPYTSRTQASQNIDSIKKKLNIKSAYILKF